MIFFKHETRCHISLAPLDLFLHEHLIFLTWKKLSWVTNTSIRQTGNFKPDSTHEIFQSHGEITLIDVCCCNSIASTTTGKDFTRYNFGAFTINTVEIGPEYKLDLKSHQKLFEDMALLIMSTYKIKILFIDSPRRY